MIRNCKRHQMHDLHFMIWRVLLCVKYYFDVQCIKIWIHVCTYACMYDFYIYEWWIDFVYSYMQDLYTYVCLRIRFYTSIFVFLIIRMCISANINDVCDKTWQSIIYLCIYIPLVCLYFDSSHLTFFFSYKKILSVYLLFLSSGKIKIKNKTPTVHLKLYMFSK